MKNLLLTFIFISCAVSSWATNLLDTIPYWTIYYGKVILIQGNTSQTTAETSEIRIKRDVVWQMNITFNYDTRGPIDSELEVKLDDKKLKSLKSEIKDGNFFIVPIRELIDTKTKRRRYKLDFYYSDNRGTKNRKLGTVIFLT